MSVKRFGVSLEEGLLQELDAIVEMNGFANRSQALRHLVRNSLVTEKWDRNDIVAGTLMLVYDHHKRDLLSKSTDLQHDYHNLVLSVQHVHLDHHHCVETIILKGEARKLEELGQQLIALKGIKYGKLVMSAIN